MAVLVNSNGTASATTDDTKTTTTTATTDSGTSTGKTATATDSTKATTSTTGTTGTTTTTTTDTSSPSEAVTSGTAADTSSTTASSTLPSTVYTATTTTPSTTYTSKYDEQLADLYNQIINRKAFSYNSADDELYQQYVDQYTQGGKKAMEDTMGQAADLTGGYGSTYAQRLGQQTYDEYLTGLSDKASELMQMAYQMYNDEGDKLTQQWSMLGQLADDDYSKWADQYNRDYQQASDEYAKWVDQYNRDYQQASDTYDRDIDEAEVLASYGNFDKYKELYGEDAANSMQQAYAAQVLMPLYTAGQIDAETYKEIAGVYPVGYVEPGTGSGSSSGSWYQDVYNAAVAQGLKANDSDDLETITNMFTRV